MLKKTLPLLLAILFTTSLVLSACGGTAPTSAPAPKGEATTTGSNAYPPTTQSGGSEAYPPASQPTAATSGNEAYPAGNSTQSAFQIAITKADGSSATLRMAELSQISIQQITAGTTVLMGYPLPAILTAAGIQDYQQVTFTGASSSLQLTKDKVTDKVILYTKDGQLSVAGTDIPADQWVTGITKIEVK
jgi:hypothetical protein